MLPENITLKSTKNVWWTCSKCGHEWQASVAERVKNKQCPCCAGNVLVKNKNDLLTLYPEIINYWNFEKNKKGPDEYTIKSNDIVHWKCNKNHSWKAKISKIIANNFNCPICSNLVSTSFPEQAIYYYLKKYFPDALNRKKFYKNELDIYIPALKLGIEYDGDFYHNDKTRDDKKDSYFHDNYNIHIIHITENRKINKENYYTYNPSNSYYGNIDEAIKIIFDYITHLTGMVFTEHINIEKDRPYIYDSYIKKVEYKESIAFQYPKLAKEWDYEKNYPLLPDNISANIYAWWKCEHCGNELFDTVSNRAKKNGCTLCQCADIPLTNMLVNNMLEGNIFTYKGFDKKVLQRETYLFYNQKEWICDCGNVFVSSALELMNGYKCPKCRKQIKNPDIIRTNYNKIINDQADRINRRKFYFEQSKTVEKKPIVIKSKKTHDNNVLDLIFMTDNLMKNGIDKITNNSYFDRKNHKMKIDITITKYKNKIRKEIRPLIVARNKDNINIFYGRVGDYFDKTIQVSVERDEKEMTEIRFDDFPQFCIINGVVSLVNNSNTIVHSTKELENLYDNVTNVYIIFMPRNSKLYRSIDKMINMINKTLI